MKTAFYYCLILAILCFQACSDGLSPELEDMQQAARGREAAEKAFLSRLNALTFSLEGCPDAEQRYRIQKKLAEEYIYFNLDSAIHYIHRNMELSRQYGNLSWEVESRLALARSFVQGGAYQEAHETLSGISPSDCEGDILKDYYYAKILYLRELRNDSADKILKQAAQVELQKYMELLSPLVPKDSYIGRYLAWEDSRNRGDTLSGLSLGPKMVEVAVPGTSEYSEACFFTSLTYYDMGDREEDFKWLCRAVTNDFNIVSRSSPAVYSVIHHFLYRKDILRAAEYTFNYALQDAIAYHGRKNLWRLSRTEKDVQAIYSAYTFRRTVILFALLIGMIVFAGVSIVLLLIVYKNNRKLKTTKSRLKNANKVKEQYISTFIQMLSESAAEKRIYASHVLQMIRQGKTAALQEEILRMPEENLDIEQFNHLFDSTFNSLYPEFVDQFNSFLKPGEEIVPPDKESLTPELRIYALVRLGITDVTRIADLLHYSPRTVYNYRVKIRNKTKYEKDQFDKLISSLQEGSQA